MLARALASVVVAAGLVAAQEPDEDGRYTISAPGIKAQVSWHLIGGPFARLVKFTPLAVHSLRRHLDQSFRQGQEWRRCRCCARIR
jgi:hypothetical protein